MEEEFLWSDLSMYWVHFEMLKRALYSVSPQKAKDVDGDIKALPSAKSGLKRVSVFAHKQEVNPLNLGYRTGKTEEVEVI